MDKLTRLLVSLYKDKAFDCLGLSPKQLEALGFLTDNETKQLAFGGGVGGGKSWLGCTWLLMNCLAYPDTKWFIGRDSLKNLRESTVITFYKVCRELKVKVDDVLKYNGQDHYFQFNNGSRIDLLDLGFYPSDPLFERLGSREYTGGWVEEGGEVEFAAFEVLYTRIGRHYNDKYKLTPKILVTCNPKKNWLYQEFYKPYVEGKLEKIKRFIQSLVTDNPKIDSGYVESIQNTKDKQRKERLLYGNWDYEDDPSSLIDFDKISDLFTNSFVPAGRRYITADIARFGRDKSRIILWNGWRAEYIISYEKKNTVFISEKLKELMNRYQIPKSNVIADEDGVGGGVVDMVGCKGFVNNSSPLNDENYDNLKSQCYYKLAEKINEGQVYVVCSEDEKKLIIEELEQVKNKNVDKDGKQGILPKDRVKTILGRSPDYSDALMMRMYFELKKYNGKYSII